MEPEKIKVVCWRCKKILLYLVPEESNTAEGVTIEIKCRNWECRQINLIKLGRISEYLSPKVQIHMV